VLRKLILAPVVALAAIIATAIPANAVTASPGQWLLYNGATLVSDGGSNAVRMKPGAAYGATDQFFNYLLPGGGGAGGMLSLCATYRANATYDNVAPTFWREDNAWRVQLPGTKTLGVGTAYTTQCAWVYNPWGGGGWVGLAASGNADIALFVKTVTIN
jgi:hypothetical protein